MRTLGFILAITASPAGMPLAAQAPEYPGPAFTRTEVAPGVYAFVFRNQLGNEGAVDGSSVAIINDDDVVVVDAQWSPATTRRVLADIRRLTDKPVRYVINTHWHGDHWFGNQAYREAFPGVEFIAHENTLADMTTQEVPDLRRTWTETLPQEVAGLEERYRRGIRRDGKPFTGSDSAAVRALLPALRWDIGALKEVTPVLPTLTLTDSLVLRRGERTIVVRHLGRGNTRGDLTVWLPRERVLVLGDLMVHPTPYSFGSYLSEWIGTLRSLRTLPAVAIVPGHGEVQHDWSYLDQLVELFGSTLTQARDAVAKGLDLEATRKAVDLSAFRARFTRGDELIGRAFDAFFATPAVERAWLEARGELDKAPR